MHRARDEWRITAAYAYALGLDRTGLAWEWLRRNTDYHEDYRQDLLGRKVGRWRAGSRARGWGLVFMEDPALTARDAVIFWRPDVVSGVMRAGARQHGAVSTPLFDLWAEPGRKAVSISSDGALAIIKTGSEIYRLLFESPDDLAGRIALELRLDAIGANEDEMEAVRGFLLEHKKLHAKSPGASFRPHRHALKMMQMLQAADGRSAGESYRQIAEVLFGAEAVAEDWNDRGLFKARTRYLVKRGTHFIRGGYRQLLKSSKK